MKKSILISIILLYKTFAHAQGWIMREIYEDTLDSEPITLKSLLYCAVLIGIIYSGYKFVIYLRQQTKEKYKSIASRSILFFIFSSFLMFIPVMIVNIHKKNDLEDKAAKKFQSIVDKADYYVDFSLNTSNRIEVKKIWNNDFGKPIEDLDKLSIQYGLTENAPVFEGVNHVYQVMESPGIEILLAKAAKNYDCITVDHPYLIHYRIKPYQIRYYTQYSNPTNDISVALNNLSNEIVRKNNAAIVYGWGEIIRKEIDNKYFMMTTEGGATQYWIDKNKVCLYKGSNDYQSLYEFKTINYGNFEIMFCSQYTNYIKYGPKYDISGLHSKNHKSVIETELAHNYARLFYIIMFFALVLIVVLLIGMPPSMYPSKKDQK